MLRRHDDMEGGGARREQEQSDASSRSGSAGPVKSRGEGGLCTAARGHQLGAARVWGLGVARDVIVFHRRVRKDCQATENSAHICMFVFLLHCTEHQW